MRVTNKHGLPEGVVRAVSYDAHGPRAADITVTELIKPPQMLQLERQHDHETEVDASEVVLRMIGTAIHEYLAKRGAGRNELSEERLIVESCGWKVSGTFDVYSDADGGTVFDYKYGSVWAYVYGGRVEWEQQLNLYAFLLRSHGFAVEKLFIIPVLRDFDSDKVSDDDPTYPKAASFRWSVKLWTYDEQRIFLDRRAALHKRARLQLLWPPCSPSERWERPTTYAVVKEGATRAVAVFGDKTERGGGEAEAIMFAEVASVEGKQWKVVRDDIGSDGAKAVAVFGYGTKRGGARREANAEADRREVATGNGYKIIEVVPVFDVVTRIGSSIRCRKYCDAAPFCQQWKAEQAAS